MRSDSDILVKAINRGDSLIGNVTKTIGGDYVLIIDDKEHRIKKRYFESFIFSQGHEQMATCNITVSAFDVATMRQLILRLMAFYQLPLYKRVLRSIWFSDPVRLPISVRDSITNIYTKIKK